VIANIYIIMYAVNHLNVKNRRFSMSGQRINSEQRSMYPLYIFDRAMGVLERFHLSDIAAETGLHVNTLRKLRDKPDACNPRKSTLDALYMLHVKLAHKE
jgi:hypothetical protein